MSKVWIDLTDIEVWRGQHGGVQRVVYGIAKHFYLNRDMNNFQLGFFIFSERDKKFYETDFVTIYDRVEAAMDQALVVDAAVPTIGSKLKKYKHYVPRRIREHEPTRMMAKKAGKKAMGLLRTAHGLTKSGQVVRRAQVPVTFVKSDIVLILGKPWDNLDIQRTLTTLKLKNNFRLVQIVYDLIIPLQPHLHHESLFTQYTQHMFEAISASDLLLPISKSSAKDLKVFCERLNLTLPEVKVIRLGDDIQANRAVGLRNKPDARIKGRFLLCVGTVEIRKNHTLLYYTYKLAAERGIELPQLVIVGASGWLSHDLQYLVKHDPAMKDKIVLLNKISDTGLSWLYQNCQFTIYPSMYEGWGLPIAESLAYGKVCIASHTSSMTEIANDLIDYFSPYDSAECLKAIEFYLDTNNRVDKEREIRSKYKPISWGNTYRQVLQSIE
jgi:glycosyltransferase involved in cell wall biosynthesis